MLFPAIIHAQDRGTGPSVIQGTVIDRLTGEPLSQVRVLLHFTDDRAPLTEVTTDAGRFLFPPIPSGTYALEFERLGYGTIREALEVAEGSEIRVNAELIREAIAADPVVVTVARASRLEARGFYDRRRSGGGRFFTREEIEERTPRSLSDLFWGVPSLRVVPREEGGALILGREGCAPAFYLDGLRVMDDSQIDWLITPDDLEGIEVYSSANVPPQFRDGRCGAVLMWSRPGRPGVGSPFTWGRALVAGVFVAVAFLLTR
ncbi:MAG: hypothetical protein EA421_01160 [Gemmatimonadales bacterium]|nr:MAG: hypothetical protein EA421_01160 [Gemmatimonadales bacterium]